MATNHSLRTSTINTLFDAGVTETDIIKRTRHRSVAILATYRRDSVAALTKVSEILSAPSVCLRLPMKHQS